MQYINQLSTQASNQNKSGATYFKKMGIPNGVMVCGDYDGSLKKISQGWWWKEPWSWWPLRGKFTTGISRVLLPSASDPTSLTSAIVASVVWISLHSLSVGAGVAFETLRHALSTFSWDGSTCFVIGESPPKLEHDSIFSAKTCRASTCCLSAGKTSF